MAGKTNFGSAMVNSHPQKIATALHVMRSRAKVPQVLQKPIQSPELEAWFIKEAARRLTLLPEGLSRKDRQATLEMANRYPDGSMRLISLEEQLQMPDLILSPNDILDRARQGVGLLKDNKVNYELGTAARGIPGGGASSRAAKWARLNPVTAAMYGITETTPRPLYRVGTKTLFQHTLDLSQHIARAVGKIFPNAVMTNSENVELFVDLLRAEFGNYKTAELENTVLFNQIVLPRMWVKDQQIIEGRLYPAGHGDYPYLLAKYEMAKTLRKLGIKYLVFSNADEWLWQADPVMISIGQELFNKGHHMVIIGVKNINNQFGGGFVKKTDGAQSLVETPRLPWEILKEGKAPIALNTTFYLCDVEYLAENENRMLEVAKSLVVKELPGRKKGEVEQIFGVDSFAGDIFAEVLNPAFIAWPRLNFLGIKDGSFTTGSTPIEDLGGRTYLHYVNESTAVFPAVMNRLIAGDKTMAEILHRRGYSYLPRGIETAK